jgi:hypothetical protein
VKTGGPADMMVAVWVSRTPAWTWWLLPVVVLFQLVRWLTRHRVVGWMPMSGVAGFRLLRLRWLGWTSLRVGALAALLGMLAGSTCLAGLSLAAVIVAVGAALLEPFWSIGARLDGAGERVLLTRVHPSFSSAAELGGASAANRETARGDR